jgi:hypothetical protein
MRNTTWDYAGISTIVYHGEEYGGIKRLDLLLW